MFVLVVVEDKIKIIPEQFESDFVEVIEEQIELKYLNRVILDAGLCIAFYDFIEIGDPMIYPAEGGAHMKVKFRLVVFRPFPGEVLVGRVAESNVLGVKVTFGFFNDVIIPSQNFPSPSIYNPVSRIWTWKYGDDESSDFDIIVGSEIRFRVKTMNFTGTKSTAKGIEKLMTSETHLSNPGKADKGDNLDKAPPATLRRRSSSLGTTPDEAAVPPMQIVGTIAEDGLGLVSWWQE